MPVVMTVNTLDRLIREYRLLTPDQLKELTDDFLARFAKPEILAKELLHRDWLTAYQINQLFLSRGRDLVLGKYILLERIGAGGMGAVFKARQQSLGQIVAVKLIRKDRLNHPHAVRRFQREIQTAARLNHPNIVRAWDADQFGDTHFLVMDYVQGTDLGKLLKQRGPLPVAEACDYIRQAALGLQHAHEQGVIHRDIKPGNLLLVSGRVVSGESKSPPSSMTPGVPTTHHSLLTTHQIKILDFGLARQLQRDIDRPGASILTQQGAVVGTVDYLAPEQALDPHHVDIRADLYSLGCTFYYLLTGRPPFSGGSTTDKLLRHQSAAPVPIEQLRPEVPPAVTAIVSKLLAKRREDRYQTPAELAVTLVALNAIGSFDPPVANAPGSPTNAPGSPQVDDTSEQWSAIVNAPFPDVPPPRQREQAAAKRRRWRWQLAGLAALLLGSLALFGFFFSRSSRPPEGPKPADRPPDWDDQARAALRPLLDKMDNPKTDPDKLVQELSDFRLRYSGTPPARRAAELLMQLPSALDRLDASKIPAEERFDGQPNQLVAVMGMHGTSAVGFSPDNKTMALGTKEQTIKLLDAVGKERSTLQGHTAAITVVTFAPDGQTLASGSQDKSVALWDVNTGREKATLLGHAGPIASVAYAPDGQTLASGSQDGTVKIWDAVTGKEQAALRGHAQAVTAVAFAPDGRLLASAGADGTAKLWDLSAGGRGMSAPRWTLPVDNRSVLAVAFAPSGTTLATAGKDGSVKLWDLTDKRKAPDLRLILQGHVGEVAALVFVPDGRALISAGRDGQLIRWELPSGKKQQEWTLPDPIQRLALASDGRHLGAVNANGTVYILRLAAPVAKAYR